MPADLRLMALDTGVRYTAAASTVAAIRLPEPWASASSRRFTVISASGTRRCTATWPTPRPRCTGSIFGHCCPSVSAGRIFSAPLAPRRIVPARLIPRKLYRVRAAVDHLVTENEFAENFLQAIEELTDPATPVP